MFGKAHKLPMAKTRQIGMPLSSHRTLPYAIFFFTLRN